MVTNNQNHPEVKKVYYSIKEVSDMLSEKPFTIRKWSKLFPGLSSKTKFRHSFNQSDVQTLLTIKSLLREKMFRIEGARKFMDEHFRNSKKSAA
jgi:DNA-binding transcriptional MerR regulator